MAVKSEPVDIRRIAEWGGLVGPVAMVETTKQHDESTKAELIATIIDLRRQVEELTDALQRSIRLLSVCDFDAEPDLDDLEIINESLKG